VHRSLIHVSLDPRTRGRFGFHSFRLLDGFARDGASSRAFFHPRQGNPRQCTPVSAKPSGQDALWPRCFVSTLKSCSCGTGSNPRMPIGPASSNSAMAGRHDVDKWYIIMSSSIIYVVVRNRPIGHEGPSSGLRDANSKDRRSWTGYQRCCARRKVNRSSLFPRHVDRHGLDLTDLKKFQNAGVIAGAHRANST